MYLLDSDTKHFDIFLDLEQDSNFLPNEGNITLKEKNLELQIFNAVHSCLLNKVFSLKNVNIDKYLAPWKYINIGTLTNYLINRWYIW